MNKKYDIAFWAVWLVFGIAFTLLIFNNNVWYDEAYSMSMIKHSFADICLITAEDVHPPMYYFLLKLFTMPFGYSLISAKIFSVLPMQLLLILGYYQLSYISQSKKTGLIFAIMIAALPVMTAFTSEIRMYLWCALFVTGCGIFGIRACDSNQIKHYIIFTFFGLMCAYTHYFALVSAGIIYLFVLIKNIRHPVKFIICSVCTIILYLPWLMPFIAQLSDKVENEYWIEPITISTIAQYFKVWFKCGNLTGIYLAVTGLICIVSISGLIINGCSRIRKIALAAAGVFILTNLIGILASIAVRPVFIERYAIPALPLLLSTFALGISSVSKKSITAAVTVFYIAGFCYNYPFVFKNEYNEPESSIGIMLEDAQYQALLCYVDSHLYGVLSYYAPLSCNVYRPKLSKGSPFTNIRPISELNTNTCIWAAMFLPHGSDIPEDIASEYNVDFIRNISTYGIECDMYNLWK